MKKIPLTYTYCRICGHSPKGEYPRMNFGPVRFWEPDDGWIIGALCPDCYKDYGHAQPKEGDCAFVSTNTVCDEVATDEDPMIALAD